MEFIGGGQYYWRIGAEISGRKEYSESRKVNVIADSPVRLIQPGSNEKFSFVTASPLISFRWGENDLAVNYILEIASDQNFKKSSWYLYHAPDRARGGYHFGRYLLLAGAHKRGSRRPDVFRMPVPFIDFIIERKRELERLTLTAPPDGNNLSGLQFKTSGTVFGWKALGQISKV